VAGDSAAAWLDLGTLSWDADYFALAEDLGNATMGWILRCLDAEARWSVTGVEHVANDWTLEEVVR
jgi:hypothetical protein